MLYDLYHCLYFDVVSSCDFGPGSPRGFSLPQGDVGKYNYLQ
ncbi:hypothetical protein ND16A_0722 [Thalassotalea sp. ND16A]|nr:hypothetical protein ND16A_0722 [Thalassotalea sp. ND16A]